MMLKMTKQVPALVALFLVSLSISARPNLVEARGNTFVVGPSNEALEKIQR